MDKICYGAGAVGGFIGALLARSGCTVSAVARNQTLAAIKRHGLRLQLADDLLAVPIQASATPAELGQQDLVIVAVKSQAMASVAASIGPLIGPDTVVLTAMNGVPWWYFQGFGGKYQGMQLSAVDPDGSIAKAIPEQAIVGAVVYGSFALNEPGFVRQVFGNNLTIGEPDGSRSARG